jgi:hypothetical protein
MRSRHIRGLPTFPSEGDSKSAHLFNTFCPVLKRRAARGAIAQASALAIVERYIRTSVSPHLVPANRQVRCRIPCFLVQKLAVVMHRCRPTFLADHLDLVDVCRLAD